MIAMYFCIHLLWAEPMSQHKQEMQNISIQVTAYEKLLDELKERKTKTPEGTVLEDILSEIAEAHKEILTLRQKQERLKQHLRKDHPNEAYSDLSFYKQDPASAKKEAKANAALDKKLDDLLKQIQAQYARTLSEDFRLSDQLQTEQDVKEKLKQQRTKTKLEDKKRYIKEQLNTTIKPE